MKVSNLVSASARNLATAFCKATDELAKHVVAGKHEAIRAYLSTAPAVLTQIEQMLILSKRIDTLLADTPVEPSMPPRVDPPKDDKQPTEAVRKQRKARAMQ